MRVDFYFEKIITKNTQEALVDHLMLTFYLFFLIRNRENSKCFHEFLY